MRWLSLAVAGLLVSTATAGCAQQQPSPAPRTVTQTPSALFLSKPVSSGWLRTVGRKDGLVLVFDCESRAASYKGVRFRFTLFNDGPTDRRWDDVLFAVRYNRTDHVGGDAFMGDYPHNIVGPYDPPSLVLRSGESTSHTGIMQGALGGDDGMKGYRLLPFVRTSRGAPPVVSGGEVEVEMR